MGEHPPSRATPDNGWVNTADSQNPDLLATAGHILATTIFGTLSTSSPDGMPWASPVFFCYDLNWNLYWASTMAARHSQNLYHNQGRAAIAVYSSDREEGQGQGIYLAGTAAEAGADDVSRVIPILLKRAARNQHRTPADYLAPSPRRLYRFQPHTVWITGERIALSESILIDTKVQLDLPSLIARTAV